MNVSRFRCAILALAGVACAAAVNVALAAPMSFSVPLKGSEQVPPVQTRGTCDARLIYDPDTRQVTWNVTCSNLSSPVTMAHFHLGTAGKNGEAVVWLTKVGGTSTPIDGPIQGASTLTPDQAKDFVAGNLYINVHTKDHPDGEVRGQVVPPK
ncbi:MULTISPECIES: CHRD domain-containing protein [unclassified Paraburkholderia]|uniref:CHRD domain-containing protein n=1 Tax=unclassified Paraburkholderia TaxID=2615204 RepID=UPI002AB7943E|nr:MULTISPECIES: CHRD domain-containing protein [unclassified Paraburkholderia]